MRVRESIAVIGACAAILGGGLCASVAGGPADGGEQDPVAAVEAERRAKEEYFRDHPWSPLRAIERYDFAHGDTNVAILGSGEGVDLRLDAEDVEPRQLQITFLDPAGPEPHHPFRLENLGTEKKVVVDGGPLGGHGNDAAVRDIAEETLIEIGPFAVRPYVQSDTGILILFDSRLTADDRFVPPSHFPIDPTWRFEAPLIRSPEPRTVRLQTSLGRTKEYRRVGHFMLRVGESTIKVYAYQPTFVERPAELLSILFTDLTTGKETYGTGRYLDLDPPIDGLYTIDFNRAYNPLCDYTSAYNCPIPPRENRLEVAIRAGERDYHRAAR